VNGAGPGATRRRTLHVCLLLALLAAAALVAKALFIAHGAPRDSLSPDAWQAWPGEITSFFGLMAALPIAVATHRLSQKELRPSFRVGALTLGALLFSIVHVSATLGVRELLGVRLTGAFSYDIGRDWLHLLAGDLVAWAVALVVLRAAQPPGGDGFAAPAPGVPVAGTPDPPEALPNLVQFRDGARTLSIDVADLRAVSGGGNYIELVFGPGQRRMLRTTLAAAGAVLAERGFRRTHKSWLVRVTAVQEIERTASGDFRLDLGDGIAALLSRRQRALLEEIRRACPGGAKAEHQQERVQRRVP